MNSYEWSLEKRLIFGKLFLFVFVFGSCMIVDNANAQDLGWSVTQPITSGRITAISSSVNGVILAGATPARGYKSTDDGFTWTEFAIDPSVISTSISEIEIRDDGFAIAGTFGHGGNVYRSFDFGDTWEILYAGGRLKKIVFQDDGSFFYNNGNSIFRMYDYGDSWDLLIGILHETIWVWDFSINSEGLLYAAAHGCEENVCGLLLRSSDGGDTWEEIVDQFYGIPLSDVVVSELGFVFVTRQATSAVFRAEDGLIPTPLSVIDLLGYEVFSFFSSSENVLVASTIAGGVRYSVDNGASWKLGGLTEFVVTAASETASGHLLAGTEAGIHRSGTVVLDREDEAPVPRSDGLITVEKPYPNPSTGQVRMSLSTDAPSHVSVKVYSPLGKELMTVVSETFSPGTRLVEWSMLGHAAGTYFVVVTDERSTQSFPFTLIR